MATTIELEYNGNDGSVGIVTGTTERKIRDSFREFPGCYYLLWVDGARTDTPLKSWGAVKTAIAKEVIEAE